MPSGESISLRRASAVLLMVMSLPIRVASLRVMAALLVLEPLKNSPGVVASLAVSVMAP